MKMRFTGQDSSVFPTYPFLLAASMVLIVWTEADVSLFSVLRSLAVVLVAVTVVFVSVSMALGTHRAALVAAVLLLLVRTTSPMHVLLSAVLIGLIAVTIGVWTRIRRKDPLSLSTVTRAANRLALILLVVVMASSIPNGTLTRSLSDASFAVDQFWVDPEEPSASLPSFYLILLDAYPRADTLSRVFDFDNRAFLDDLSSRGFTVAPASQSNYMWTTLSLASTIDMRHVESSPVTDQLERINDGRALREFRERGYRIVASAVPWEGVALRRVDELCGDGKLNEFERHLLRSSVLMSVVSWLDPSFLAARQRAYVTSGFECIHRHAGNRQQLFFAHIGSPHLPIVFERDGTPASTRYYSDAMTRRDMAIPPEEFRAAYLDQLSFVNAETIRAVDAIVDADPEAVVLLASDHGSEFNLHWTDPDQSDLEERFGTLFAARTPGVDHPYPPDVTLVNLFPPLFRAYFDLDVPDVADHQFISSADDPLRLERWD